MDPYKKIEIIKDQILSALQHVEAEEGLYLRNFNNLHEEDERPAVEGTSEEILDVLNMLLEESVIRSDGSGEDIIFTLVQ